jgi:hypothetical protein
MESDHTCPLAYYPVISPAGDKQIFAVVKLRITDGHFAANLLDRKSAAIV